MACLPIFSTGFVVHAIVVDRMGPARFSPKFATNDRDHRWLAFVLVSYRAQGKRLKYDAREQLEKSGKFSFRNQVWDNVF
tara:strand:- start:1163 stop:1402 length:240 start_codon:yes stop_codon:yes gene_type:complete